MLLTPLAWWFGWANRYVVFLYTHLGAEPFDAVTRSRYWMSGLVASGLVLLYWTLRCWLGGLVARWRHTPWEPPEAWQVWRVWALPTALGVLAITTTLGAPVLPLSLALGCAAVAVLGLVLALAPGRMAAARPGALLWLSADGAGLVPPLVLLRVVSPELRARLGVQTACVVAVGSLLGASLWFAALGGMRGWRRRTATEPVALLAAGLAEAYLLLPLAHYVLSDPGGPYYISTASNFFPDNLWHQPVVVAATGAVVWLACAWRRRVLPLEPPALSG
ncbi:MAG: hypothetical protein R6X16_11405 [Anaerolineae bacterium]